ncbi:hypothetical protein AB1Y20_008041 [Prymnesium parvum]|uniref:Vta1/callose synthase N-terminal domain-containing protein n=1 Tax=Prymnesium parvum TaxID=97485 RepID=A0AB34IT26_PRYPA|mmetsp:Transcript_4316/g.10737  ORF Transcript_4316/g.10737 Transcript_4316/m.10737 type:complete len:337 (-) Transcript_4316:522-1532(-)
MVALADLPASLKSIKPYLERGADIASKDPVVAYHCRLFALQEAMGMRTKIPKEDMGYVLGLMDDLEKEKKSLGKTEHAQVQVENFAQDLFQKADNLDRSGHSDLRTAKAFLASAHVMEACKQFGEFPTDLAEKAKYAKWRFVEIAKATKERRPPAPPRGMEDFEDYSAGDAGGIVPTTTDGAPASGGSPEDTASPSLPATDYPDYMGLPDARSSEVPGYSTYSELAPPIQHARPVTPPATDAESSFGIPSPPGGVPYVPHVMGQPSPQMTPSAMLGAVAGFKPSRPAILEAVNVCKAAISALQFQDSDTAVHQLNQALILLTQPPMPSAQAPNTGL